MRREITYCGIQLKILFPQKRLKPRLKEGHFGAIDIIFHPFLTLIVPLNTGFAELLRDNLSRATLLMAGHTFFDNDVDRALALQVPFIFNC